MSDLAPIVLFVYNRPAHTQQTISALQKNLQAQESDLIVYSDAAKTEKDHLSVLAVREYLKTVSGFKSVSIIERDENYGLARSIVDGVTTVINQYGKIIVLEDDLVTSSSFLEFMNDALDHYESDERVMNVNGYLLPDVLIPENNCFFIRIPSSWGWATWSRSWKHFHRNADWFIKSFSVSQKHQFDFESEFPFFRTILRNKKGELNTWAIFWYAVIFERNGLCITPNVSQVKNIGHDGSGSNCRATDLFEGQVVANFDIVFPDNIVESQIAYENYRGFYNRSQTGILNVTYLYFLRMYRKLLLCCFPVS